LELAGRHALSHAAAMPSLRVRTWNIAGARREGSNQLDLDMAAGPLSNRQGHNVRQLRELQQLAASRAAPRLLLADLNLPSTVCNDPAGVVRARGPRVAATPVSDHRALVVELDVAAT
jgi:hypothetical protein